MAVQRTQRAAQDAEAKLGTLKRWDRELENRATPLMKQTEQLQGFLATDMARAVAYLDQVLKALDAYRNVTLPGDEKPAAVEPAKIEEMK
jgi:deoxyhypusine synthase